MRRAQATAPAMSPASQKTEYQPEQTKHNSPCQQQRQDQATTQQHTQCNTDQYRNRHQSQEERPGVEQEEECVGAVDQKRHSERQPVENKAADAAQERIRGFLFLLA